MTPNSASGTRRNVTRLTVLLAATAAVWACDDPYAPRADQANTNQTFMVAALTGTSLDAPAALQLVNKSITRIDGSFDFDMAFDIDKQNRPVVLPLGLVGTPISGSRLVGLLRVTGTFDNVTEAPKSGYVFDSAMVVAPGAVLAVQAQENICSMSFTPYIFAKVVIDSLNLGTRRLYGRTLINLNCGFRSLATGTPTF